MRPFTARQRTLRAVAVVAVAVTGLAVGTLSVPAQAAAPAVAAPYAATSVGTTADSGAVVTSEQWGWDLRTLDIKIKSPGLLNAEMPVRLLTPPGWSHETTRSWPLLVLLHGGADNYTAWTRETAIEELSAKWGVLIAMPDAGFQATYTDYYNAGRGGYPKWETFHTEEMIQILERGYKANTSRAIIGLSSGGLGAMMYVGRNPGLFKYGATFSGPVAIRLPAVRTLIMYSAGDADPFARWGAPLFNERNWAEHDPVYLAPRMRGTKIFVSSGMTSIPQETDPVAWSTIQLVEPFTYLMSQTFASKARSSGVSVKTDFYVEGQHTWENWRGQLNKVWVDTMNTIGATQTS